MADVESTVHWVKTEDGRAIAERLDGLTIFEWRTRYDELMQHARKLVPTPYNLQYKAHGCMYRDASECAKVMLEQGGYRRPCPMRHVVEDVESVPKTG